MRPNLRRNNKKKIFNDPVYGFISIPNEIIFDLIEHPYFQRLRRIKQLGLTHLVYPGALHTRFHHALGAMNLMTKSIQVIRRKGTEITEEEEQAVLAAILMHDIGHGPFSHTLEHDIVHHVSHEKISAFFLERMAKDFPFLHLSLDIFRNNYPKKFLHQLVSSQLDMDRMDYLNRDSFYTGVSEGVIGSERIIEMLDVKDNMLVLEEKGIYSVEKFLVARRLMYWQVYLHKTVVSSEFTLKQVIRRARFLVSQNVEIFASPALKFFLSHEVTTDDFQNNPEVLDHFATLDDFDIMGAIKVWCTHSDKILADLSSRLVNRKLLKTEIAKEPFSQERLEQERQLVIQNLGISPADVDYYIFSEKITNSAYNKMSQSIQMIKKNGETTDVAVASDNLNISALGSPVEKYCLCYPVL
ncbi:MAG: HD domain-containing protein [Crocinitomicaceae bacterium]|nr:HD domain-containing protein [Crocinitomicaceae bacterium]